MNILVFLKQVPASTEVRMNPETHTLIRSGAKSQTNPDDLHALQMAVDMRAQTGGSITAVTMGPPQATAVLREAMLLGADKGILLTDKLFAGSDTLSTGFVLAALVQKLGNADILVFGKQAIDGDTAQVGPSVAARLGLPQLTDVRKIKEVTSSHIVLQRESGNALQTLKSPLPCVLTVSKEANQLSIPTLRAWEKAQAQNIVTWGAKDLKLETGMLGLTGSPTRVVHISVPESTSTLTRLQSVDDLINLFTKKDKSCPNL